jgi:hypothetical protein
VGVTDVQPDECRHEYLLLLPHGSPSRSSRACSRCPANALLVYPLVADRTRPATGF